MARSRPALVTVALSAAAVLGYLSYRALNPTPVPSAATVTGAAPADPSSAAPEGQARELVAQLPDFSLDTVAGTPQSIKSWPGKPLLINFWATWCGPCLREIPMLKKFQTEHPDLQVVGIAVDHQDAVAAFADKMQFDYPILIGESEGWAAAAKFGVDFYALPFTVFTAADGAVLGVHTGELHPEQLENLTATLQALHDGKIQTADARSRLAGRE